MVMLSGCTEVVEVPTLPTSLITEVVSTPKVIVEPVESEPPMVVEIEPPVETEPPVVEIEPIINEPVFELSEYERWVVECMVMGESGGEPYDGQVLVAQCILNACRKEGILPSEVRVEYKYSGWNEQPTDSVKQAVSAVFDDGYTVTDEPILYFYAPRWCNSKWHETQRFVIEVGGHRFFTEWE